MSSSAIWEDYAFQRFCTETASIFHWRHPKSLFWDLLVFYCLCHSGKLVRNRNGVSCFSEPFCFPHECSYVSLCSPHVMWPTNSICLFVINIRFYTQVKQVKSVLNLTSQGKLYHVLQTLDRGGTPGTWQKQARRSPPFFLLLFWCLDRGCA